MFLSFCKAAVRARLPENLTSQAFHQAHCFPVTNCGSHAFTHVPSVVNNISQSAMQLQHFYRTKV